MIARKVSTWAGTREAVIEWLQSMPHNGREHVIRCDVRQRVRLFDEIDDGAGGGGVGRGGGP